MNTYDQKHATRKDRLEVASTGDGSYEPLIAELQRMNVRVSVCCSKLSTADCLRRAADHFIDMEDLRGLVGKEME